jgi:hypothetical protein
VKEIIMNDNDDEALWASKTHPHVAVLQFDPVMWTKFESTFENRPEVKIRKLDTSEPDIWTVYVACASEAVKDRLEETW